MNSAANSEPDLSVLGEWTFSSEHEQTVSVVEEPLIQKSDQIQVVAIIAPPECIAILRTVMEPLPLDLPAALLILVRGHTSQDRPIALNLNEGRFPVQEAMAGKGLKLGHASIAQTNAPIGIGESDMFEKRVHLGDEQNASLLFQSLAAHYGRNIISVILTGLNDAETEAMRTIRSHGGRGIVLDDSDRSWLHENAVKVVPDPQDVCLPAEMIGAEILRMVMER